MYCFKSMFIMFNINVLKSKIGGPENLEDLLVHGEDLGGSTMKKRTAPERVRDRRCERKKYSIHPIFD